MNQEGAGVKVLAVVGCRRCTQLLVRDRDYDLRSMVAEVDYRVQTDPLDFR